MLVHTLYIKKWRVGSKLFRTCNSQQNLELYLIIWDKIFGTFQKELDCAPIDYRLNKLAEYPQNQNELIFYE